MIMFPIILGKNKANSTLFLPHGPKSVSILRDELKASFMVGLNPGIIPTVKGKKF